MCNSFYSKPAVDWGDKALMMMKFPVSFCNFTMVFHENRTNVEETGAIPMLHQVMSATRGATDAFSGLGMHANSSVS